MRAKKFKILRAFNYLRHLPQPQLLFLGLLKWIDFQRDVESNRLELRFFKTMSGEEIDFIVVSARTVVQMIECKLKPQSSGNAFRHLTVRFPKAERFVITLSEQPEFRTGDGVVVVPAVRFLGGWCRVGELTNLNRPF